MRACQENSNRKSRSDRGGIFFRLMFLIFLVIFAFVIYLARYPILRFAGNFWVVDESPQTSDAIVISRVTTTMKLCGLRERPTFTGQAGLRGSSQAAVLCDPMPRSPN